MSKVLTKINTVLNEKMVSTKSVRELEKELVSVAKKHGFRFHASDETAGGDELVIRFKKI